MNLQLKLIRTKKLLKVWNREVFGNIIQNLKDAEQAVLEAQILYDSDPTPAHRAEFSRVSAELIITAKMEEEFWRQKVAIRWAADGERNSKFFHGWVRQKRIKSRIHTVEFGGQALTEETEIRESAAAFFQQLLTSDVGDLVEPDLSLIHTLPDLVDQEALCAPPQEKEWDTVGRDVIAAVADFFSGAFMPRSLTATMIVLIPKKPNPITWVSGFIKCRLLSDNALLAQELIHDLGKELSSRGRLPNLALKLDMAKAYDRVQWPFLLKVLETMGFSIAWKVNNGKTHFFWRLSTWSLLALLRRLEAFKEG
ncbi:uncharacterized protein LOC121796811 [Salvia splendens]|uniref:uncharacterized protein LOC121796811 n=1 Tax=Salvia splendens TaxID=180675 RepID=UPI001C26A274|nr:uncharacterized protein LOC121796811 [Salvia splendens]